jgi:chromosome segregation ATPase
MASAKALEADRATAEGHLADLAKRAEVERDRFAGVDTERKAAIGAAEHALAQVSEELATRVGERAGHRAAASKLDAQLRQLSRQALTQETAALKATDPTAQGAARGEVDALRTQIAALEPEREKFAGRAAELDAPIADLEGRVATANEEIARLRAELAELTRQHAGTLGSIQSELERDRAEIATKERELSLKFVTLGTLLNLNRQAGPRFDPLYQQFDEINRHMTTRDEEVTKLEHEIGAYDRAQLQRGGLVLGAALLLVVVLVIVLARA